MMLYVKTSWICEWSTYLYDMRELAKQFDPSGVEGFEKELQNFSPVLLNFFI